MIALVTALLCAAGGGAGASPPAIDPPETVEARWSETVRFADWLLARGDYYRAIGEYERALFLDPGRDPSGAIALRIARAYAAGGKPDAAVEILRDLTSRGEGAVREEALFEIGLVRYRAGNAEAAVAALERYVALPAPAGGPGSGRARLLLSLSLLHSDGTGRARAALDGIPEGGALARDAADLRAATFEVERAPRKNPALAGVLSAVVPGLGHAYAGDPGGAAGAFVLNGLFIWGAVDAFRGHNYGMGALLLVGESIWYGGAIFGAVAEAMRFNRDMRAAALERIDARFRWVVDVAPQGATVGIRGVLDPSGTSD